MNSDPTDPATQKKITFNALNLKKINDANVAGRSAIITCFIMYDVS